LPVFTILYEFGINGDRTIEQALEILSGNNSNEWWAIAKQQVDAHLEQALMLDGVNPNLVQGIAVVGDKTSPSLLAAIEGDAGQVIVHEIVNFDLADLSDQQLEGFLQFLNQKGYLDTHPGVGSSILCPDMNYWVNKKPAD
jgi:hypothetical protein